MAVPEIAMSREVLITIVAVAIDVLLVVLDAVPNEETFNVPLRRAILRLKWVGTCLLGEERYHQRSQDSAVRRLKSWAIGNRGRKLAEITREET